MAVTINGTTGIDKVQDGTIVTADIAADAVTASKLNVGQLSHRNLIINGAMQVAQRGTSFTNTTGYQIDRWFVANPGTNTVNQVFDTTLNMYCMSVTQSVGYGTVYRIEDKDVKHLKAGDVVTLSYWINVTSGDFKVSTTATSQVSVSTTTIDTATGWYRRSASYTLTSSEVAAITGGSYLQINIEPAATSYKLTGVQLEVGSEATPFEHRSYADELQRCMRYYYQLGPYTNQYEVIFMPTWATSTTTQQLGFNFPVKMRAAPTITHNGVSEFRVNDNLQHDEVCNYILFSQIRPERSMATFGKASANLNVGYSGYINTNNYTSATIYIDAEL